MATAHSIMAYIDHHILRLMHFDNLEHILKHGMYSKNSGHIIPNYVNIGDATLIKQRETFTVRIDPPNGNLGDYIPFYFARTLANAAEHQQRQQRD